MDTFITTTHGTVSLRQANESDTQAFRILRLEALRNHPDVFSADYTANFEQPATFWSDRLHSLGTEGMIYFATHNENLIGMCGIRRGNSPKLAHSATIWGVYIQPEWRGLQIAAELVIQCTQWAQAQGIKILKLAVVATNAAAIRCYTRCGFTVYGVEPMAILFDGNVYDEILMARVIESVGV